jgi:hypothetical protein
MKVMLETMQILNPHLSEKIRTILFFGCTYWHKLQYEPENHGTVVFPFNFFCIM